MSLPIKDSAIGFIGLGAMGHAMVSRLGAAGLHLCVYDNNDVTYQSVKSTNTHMAAHPADIAQQCEIVFLCLPNVEAVESVLFGKRGLLGSTTNKVKTIIDTSTLNVQRTRLFAQQVSEASDADYCDCPVTGLPAKAISGELTAMFGGSAASFDAAKTYVTHFANNVLHCGEIGQGQLTKAFNNVIYDINIAAFCELMPLAVKSGLDPSLLENVLNNGSASSFASKHFLPRILDRQFSDDFSLQAAYKDIENVNAAKQSEQANTPLFDAMQAHYQKSLAAGYGAEPKSALIKLYEQALDVTISR